MKKVSIVLVLIAMFLLSSTASYAGWLIYHKSEFKGKVIDAEKKEPIEGAVVVAIYKKHTLISGPGGGYSSIINVKEQLTNKKGEFIFPQYTTIIQPLSKEDRVDFIIYKPGYGSYPGLQINPPGVAGPEKFFSKKYGTSATVQINNKTIKYTMGLVELPKITTREERLRATPGHITEARNKTPILNRLIEEEDKALGLK